MSMTRVQTRGRPSDERRTEREKKRRVRNLCMDDENGFET